MLRSPDATYFQSAPVSRRWGWVHGFVILQFVLQLLLLFPQFGVLRIPMRTASFALSLLLLVGLQGRGVRHPATRAAIAVFLILALSFCLNPGLNTVMAGLAQAAMYVAILAPLFWVSRLTLTPDSFQRLIWLIWGFQTTSAIFGVLQVYYPGQFQPFISTTIQEGPYGGAHLLITLANGAQVYRPMGLTDVPGGAATAGFYALLLGTGLALYYRNGLLRLMFAVSAAIGLFCIYLSQVRSILVFAGICLVVLTIVLARQGRLGRLTLLVGSAGAIALTTFTWAVSIGGDATFERIVSLFSDRPDAVYYQNRGLFLEHTIDFLLPKYPLGAGLGRWGTMNLYFGDNSNPFTQAIYVEIQWTGWLLDGGVPLILAYCLALYLACRTAWAIATQRHLGDFSLWGGLILAYNVGALAITFNYPLFISQGGMEFWLLNAVLFAAARQIPPPMPPPPQWIPLYIHAPKPD